MIYRRQVADDIQGFALIDWQKYDIMFLKRGDPFENSRCEKRMVKTILGSIKKTLLPKLQRITYNNQSIKDSQLKSDEAKNYDFSAGDFSSAVGNIKFIWTEFQCDACSKTFSINEIRESEKNK